MRSDDERLIIALHPGELIVHTLNRSDSSHALALRLGSVRYRNWHAKTSTRRLWRVDVVGTSGLTIREDVVLCATSESPTVHRIEVESGPEANASGLLACGYWVPQHDDLRRNPCRRNVNSA